MIPNFITQEKKTTSPFPNSPTQKPNNNNNNNNNQGDWPNQFPKRIPQPTDGLTLQGWSGFVVWLPGALVRLRLGASTAWGHVVSQ